MKTAALAVAGLAGIAAVLLSYSPITTDAADPTPSIPVVAVKSALRQPSPTPTPGVSIKVDAKKQGVEPDPPFANPARDNAARLAGILNAFPAAKERFAELLAERRDRDWATRSETMLVEYFDAIPHIGGPDRILSAYCGSQHCAMIVDLPTSAQPEDRRDAMAAVQSIDHVKAMFERGYWDNGGSFGPSSSDNRFMFVRFYRRGEPRTF